MKNENKVILPSWVKQTEKTYTPEQAAAAAAEIEQAAEQRRIAGQRKAEHGRGSAGTAATAEVEQAATKAAAPDGYTFIEYNGKNILVPVLDTSAWDKIMAEKAAAAEGAEALKKIKQPSKKARAEYVQRRKAEQAAAEQRRKAEVEKSFAEYEQKQAEKAAAKAAVEQAAAAAAPTKEAVKTAAAAAEKAARKAEKAKNRAGAAAPEQAEKAAEKAAAAAEKAETAAAAAADIKKRFEIAETVKRRNRYKKINRYLTYGGVTISKMTIRGRMTNMKTKAVEESSSTAEQAEQAAAAAAPEALKEATEKGVRTYAYLQRKDEMLSVYGRRRLHNGQLEQLSYDTDKTSAEDLISAGKTALLEGYVEGLRGEELRKYAVNSVGRIGAISHAKSAMIENGMLSIDDMENVNIELPETVDNTLSIDTEVAILCACFYMPTGKEKPLDFETAKEVVERVLIDGDTLRSAAENMDMTYGKMQRVVDSLRTRLPFFIEAPDRIKSTPEQAAAAEKAAIDRTAAKAAAEGAETLNSYSMHGSSKIIEYGQRVKIR